MAIDLYNQNTAGEGEPPATPPAPATPAVPAPPPVPDPVVAEQRVYTRDIATTVWAAQSGWSPGVPIPTSSILAYATYVGYTTTSHVDAVTETGIVTIVTTGSELTQALWDAFDGSTKANRVGSDRFWGPAIGTNGLAFATGIADPNVSHVLSLWFYYERLGYIPITMMRYWDPVAPQTHISTDSWGDMTYAEREAFRYQAPTPEQLRRVKIVSESYPIGLRDPFYITTQPVENLEIETGADLAGLTTAKDLAPAATETAQLPVFVRENRQVDVAVTPGYFEQTTAPTPAREGDAWLNTATGAYSVRQAGAWIATTELELGARGSTGAGRNATPTHYATMVLGFLARALGKGAVAVGAYATAAAEYGIAIGNSARAGARSIAVGRGATVPDSSPRSFVIGHSGQVPENSPDTGVLNVNQLQVRPSFVSGGNQETRLALLSPDGTLRALTIGNDNKLRVGSASVGGDGVTVRNNNSSLPNSPYTIIDFGEGIIAEEASAFIARMKLDWASILATIGGRSTPVPNAASTTDGGYLMGQAIPAGAFSELVGEILSYGINVPQVGTRNTARPGGIFRIDTRSGAREFVVFAYPVGGSVATAILRIDLNTGDTRLTPVQGNLSVGQSGFGDSVLTVGPGSGVRGQVRLVSGTRRSTAQAGQFEYDGEFWITNSAGTRAQVEKVGHIHDDRYYTESDINSLLTAMRPVTASAVRATDSGITGSTTWAAIGDPGLSIPVNSAYAHRVVVTGALRCGQVTGPTTRTFVGKATVNGVDGDASAGSGVRTDTHGPEVIETVPVLWAGTVNAGVSSVSVAMSFRQSSTEASYLTIDSGTSLIATVHPLL